MIQKNRPENFTDDSRKARKGSKSFPERTTFPPVPGFPERSSVNDSPPYADIPGKGFPEGPEVFTDTRKGKGSNMAMEGFTALPECSRKAQTTPDRARYWLKLLGVETVKSGNVRYVPNGSVDLLGNMARLVSGGMQPGEAAKKAKDETPLEMFPAKVNDVPAPLLEEMKEIRAALMTLAQEVKASREENRALRSEVSNLQSRLEYRKPEPSPHTADSITRINTQKEKPPARSAPKVSSQVELSLWESVQLYANDLSGFFLGKG